MNSVLQSHSNPVVESGSGWQIFGGLLCHFAVPRSPASAGLPAVGGSRVAQSQTANLPEVVSVDAMPLPHLPAHESGVSERSLKVALAPQCCHGPRSHRCGTPFALR